MGSLSLLQGIFPTQESNRDLLQVYFPDSSVGKESTCNAGNPGSFPGLGRSTGEGISYLLQCSWAPLVAQLVKNPLVMWIGKISWRRERLPTPVFWPREFHGLYNPCPWGHKELDTTERLSKYINMSQPLVYICPLPFEPPSHLPSFPIHVGCHRALV